VLIKIRSDSTEADLTPPEIYRDRRRFLQSGLAIAGAALGGSLVAPQASSALLPGSEDARPR
jgi:hypothetical protein